MILSTKQDLAVSSMAWCEPGSLWVLETLSGEFTTHKISEARYISIHPGKNDNFSIVHHHDDNNSIRITAHSFSDPPKILASVFFNALGGKFEGDPEIWKGYPKAYIAYMKCPTLINCYLFMIDPIRPKTEILALDWYDDSYDHGYQGVGAPVEVLGENKIIIPVQRDSKPILYDLDQRKVISKISLAERGGNPQLKFTQRKKELWAVDCDTLLRLDTTNWNVTKSILLQDTGHPQERAWLGDFSFNNGETLCAVARTYSGDVLGLDMKKFKVTHSCNLGGQPLKVVLLSDGTVYSREWKTGTLLKGHLKRKGLFS